MMMQTMVAGVYTGIATNNNVANEGRSWTLHRNDERAQDCQGNISHYTESVHQSENVA
jgi:hypothetical protein